MAKRHNSTYLSLFFVVFDDCYMDTQPSRSLQAVTVQSAGRQMFSGYSALHVFNSLLEHSHFIQVPAPKLCFVFFFNLNRSKKNTFVGILTEMK